MAELWKEKGFKSADDYATEIKRKESTGTAFTDADSANTFKNDRADLFGGGGNNLDSIINTNADAYVNAGVSSLDVEKERRLAAIQKLYEDEHANYKGGIRDAEAQFNNNTETINQSAYQNNEATKLYAQKMGIQNSQQMLGLKQGDDLRKGNMINKNLSERDLRINTLKDRITSLSTKKDIDMEGINSEYASNVQRLKSEAQLNAGNQKFQLQLGDYEFNRGQQWDVAKFKMGQEWDVKKIEIGFANQLQAMAEQNGYEIDMQNMRTRDALKVASTEAKMRLEAAEKEYEILKKRELASLDPSTDEYKIRKGKLEEEFNIAVTQKVYESMLPGIITSVFNNPNLPKDGYTLPQLPATGDKRYNYGGGMLPDSLSGGGGWFNDALYDADTTALRNTIKALQNKKDFMDNPLQAIQRKLGILD